MELASVFNKDIQSFMMNWMQYNPQEEIKKLSELEGTGGVIAIDAQGNIAMEFNTSGMFRGFLKSTGEREVAIFKED